MKYANGPKRIGSQPTRFPSLSGLRGSPMKRMSVPNLVLVAALVLLLPLERAHCAWMGVQTQTAPVAASPLSGHECCHSDGVPKSAPPKGTQQGPLGCPCQLLPSATLTTTSVAGTEAPATPSIAVLPAPTVLAHLSSQRATSPVLDAGSPPGPDDLGAHGLRAPPVST